jgi:transcription antitermination factor NusG
MLTPRQIISKGQILKKVRELPTEGEILVKVGDLVSPGDIVARTSIEGELEIVRLPEESGVILVKEGDVIGVGDLIYERRGLFGIFKTTIHAPASGTVEFITDQAIGIRLPPKNFTLNAYISGKVIESDHKQRVTIEGKGAFIQGIFGLGGERIGKLAFINRKGRLTLDDIPRDCTGLVLAGGTLPSGELLLEAQKRGAVGFVVGGVEDSALEEFLGRPVGIAMTGKEDISMTLVVTEGFGELTMHPLIEEILSREGECSVNGTTQVRAGAVRPEIVVHSEYQEEVSADEEFEIGKSVRIIREPNFGIIGKIVELPQAPELLESRIKARVLRLKTASGATLTVPRANVELVRG